ncbi:hypothetical protein GGF37_001561 [Kickxella alabastrina]|nr:hypothetical protein GGF37_001561 [Kickxella alabastrina]
MRPGKQAQPSSITSPQAMRDVKQDAPHPTEEPKNAHVPVQRAANGSAGDEEDEISRMIEAWWDQILAFFVRHRATSAVAVWLGVYIFDTMDLHMPAEWLVFTFFSFSVFVQAFGMSVLLFTALTAAMTALNVVIYCFVPFATTSLLSTIVVCMLLVRGVHGLDAKGWAVTILMSMSRMHTPWCEILPDYLQAPIAAYCTSFGILWLAYHHACGLERLLDPLCMALGIIPPLPPRVSVVEIHSDSVLISWFAPFSGGAPEIARSDTAVAAQDAPTLTTQLSTNGISPTTSTFDTSPACRGTLSASGFSNPGPSPMLSIGRLITIDRRLLPEACVSKFDVEVNGNIVGSCKSSESYTKIDGLKPAAMYQLRVWAVSESRGRAPSLPVFVTTLAASEPQSREKDASAKNKAMDSAPVDIEQMQREIREKQQELLSKEQTIAELKAKADSERNQHQQAIAELRAQRKAEEKASTEQREVIREMEIQKRRLDKEKSKLAKAILDTQAQKKQALDKLRDRERQAEEHARNAKSLADTVEQERKDHNQQQAELNTTISTLKSEVQKATQKLDSLNCEQSELAEKLKQKRRELASQEKRNGEMGSQLNDTLQKQRQIEESQVENSRVSAKLRAEIDCLTAQHNSVSTQRQKLEMAAGRRLSPAASAVSAALTPTLNFPTNALSSRHIDAFSSADSLRHGRSSSFADIVFPNHKSADNFAGYGVHESQRSQMRANNTQMSMFSTPAEANNGAIGPGYTGPTSRRSADLGDLFGFWDRGSSFMSTSSAATATSAAIDSISLRNASSVTNPSSAGFGLSAAAVGALGGADFGFSRCLSPISGGLDQGEHLSHMPFWGATGSLPSPQSTTTAEASALSILKDTDLAYPTPVQSDHRAIGHYGSMLPQLHEYKPPQAPPPIYSVFGANTPGLHQQALARVLNGSLESLDQPQQQQQRGGFGGAGDSSHFRFNSLDLRANGNWTDREFRESGRSSIVSDSRASPCTDGISVESRNSFSLCSVTPVEQPALVLSSDLVGAHRPLGGTATAIGEQRPHVEPIGAPIRRRVGGLLSPNVPTYSVQAPSLTLPSPSPSMDHYPVKYPIGREISHPSSFGESLYHERSLWDLDTAVVPAGNEKAPDNGSSR